MASYVARRLLWAVGIVFIVMTLIFNVLMGIGDPAASQLGANASPEARRDFSRRHGFHEPVWKQYLSYLGIIPCVRHGDPEWDSNPDQRGYCGLLQGDMGEAMQQNTSVSDVLMTRFPRTLILIALAMTFELSIGLVFGVIAAVRRNTWFDTGFMGLAFLGISAPTFLTGLLFLNWLAFRLGWFPIGGYGYTFAQHLYHAILPAFTLAIIGAATYARIMRSEMIDTLRSDYIRTAKAKGVHPLGVVVRHAVRNAMLPIVTMLGLQTVILVQGAVITETIYAWPGMGWLVVESVTNLDVYTVMGVVLLASLTVQLGNLLADIAVASLDPRVRLEARSD